LSRPFRVADVPKGGTSVEIVADDAERARLAAAYGLICVERLEARLTLRPASGGGIKVRGHLSADVTYACIVTLDPVPGRVEEDIDVRFALAAAPQRRAREDIEIDLSLDANDDPPEPIVNGVADLGVLVAEFLALGLDPYPRAAGAELARPGPDGTGVPDRPSPFAALGSLKGSRSS